MQIDYSKLRKLLDSSKFISLATVNEDLTPHNSPVFFINNDALTKIYWGSHPKAVHSKNVIKDGNAFGVTYDVIENQAIGLYFELINCREAVGEELDQALNWHNQKRQKLGKDPLDKSYYELGEQCMYIADIATISTNLTERGEDGHLKQDHRVEVNLDKLRPSTI